MGFDSNFFSKPYNHSMVKHDFVSMARGFLVPALGAAGLILLWTDADKHREAKPLPAENIEFAPNRRAYYAWPLVIAYLAYATYATIHRLIQVHGKPIDLFIAVSFAATAVQIAVSFPAKIVVDADGLEQVTWLWKNKRIRWDDIVEINTGEKSRTITITGTDGTKIVHSRQLPDRERLLMELKTRCGDNLPTNFPNEPITGT